MSNSNSGEPDREGAYTVQQPQNRKAALKQRADGAGPTRAVQKTKVMVLAGLIIAGFIWICDSSVSSEKIEIRTAASGSRAGTSGLLHGLPESYGDLNFKKEREKTVERLVSPELPRANLNSEYLKWLQQQEKERVERAKEAQHSALAFNVSLPEPKKESEIDPTARAQFGGGESGDTLNELSKVPPHLQAVGGDGDRDFANRQDDKRAFLSEERDGSGRAFDDLETPVTKYIVQGGQVIPGVFITGINSDLPGPIKGQVSQAVRDNPTGEHVLIPQGSVLLGEYDSTVTFGQSRVLMVWTRIVYPNGKSVDLKSQPGADLSGYAGVGGDVDRHFDDILFATLIGSGIGAGAQIAEGNTSVFNPTFGQLALQGVSRQINQTGQRFVERTLDRQPTITIEPGERFNVIVVRDFALEPYSDVLN